MGTCILGTAAHRIIFYDFCDTDRKGFPSMPDASVPRRLGHLCGLRLDGAQGLPDVLGN